MKLMRYVTMLSTLIVATQGVQVAAAARHVDNTGDLVELCSVTTEDPSYAAAMGFCLGYVDAAMDYHAALTEGPDFDPIACPQTSVTREQVVAVLLEWSRRNTQYLEGERPVTGLMRAAAEKWPCTER